jgi:hypothetical protein
MEREIGDILDEVERGRLGVDQAVRLLLAPPALAAGRGMRWVRVEFGAGRPVRFRLPFAPAAMLLAGIEVALYPAVVLAARIAASRTDDVQIRRVLSGLPFLPISRILLAVLRSGAPFAVAVKDGAGGFSISVD